MQQDPHPFSGLKVIELASVLAGPSVGMFFAELGAEVIKIENPRTGGDNTRGWKLPDEPKDRTWSAYFCSVNWGKRHLMLDLRLEQDRAEVLQLVAQADVLISNYKPGDDAKLGVDYQTLSALNPRLVYGHITGYGDDDPRAAFDVVLQGECGYMQLNSQSGTGPVNFPMAMIDILAAHHLKQGIVTALWQRERTGKGAYVSASLFDSGITALTNQATNWLNVRHKANRNGSRHPNIAPYGELITTNDGLLTVLAVGTQAQFAGLCQVLGCAELVDDERFCTVQQRVVHRTGLDRILQHHASSFTRKELLEKLAQHKVPAGAVLGIDEVFDQPLAQRMILRDVMDDGTEALRPSGVAFRINR